MAWRWAGITGNGQASRFIEPIARQARAIPAALLAAEPLTLH